MGLFENLGRKVESFKQRAEDAAEETTAGEDGAGTETADEEASDEKDADRECADCGEPVNDDRSECPSCGGHVVAAGSDDKS